MKKRILALSIMSFFILTSTICPFLKQSSISLQEPININETKTSDFFEQEQEENTIGIIIKDVISANQDKLEIYIYPNLYMDFTQEEIYMIQRVVETETYTADIESKMNIVSVVFNRFNHPNKKYGKDIIDIITTPNQFAYWRTEISETTIQAVENVYKYGDTTGGCIAYRSDKHPQYWYSWEYQFTDKVGHHFYKEVITEGE